MGKDTKTIHSLPSSDVQNSFGSPVGLRFAQVGYTHEKKNFRKISGTYMFPECSHKLQIMDLCCSRHEGTHQRSVVTPVFIKSRQEIMTFEASLVSAARPRIKNKVSYHWRRMLSGKFVLKSLQHFQNGLSPQTPHLPTLSLKEIPCVFKAVSVFWNTNLYLKHESKTL